MDVQLFRRGATCTIYIVTDHRGRSDIIDLVDSRRVHPNERKAFAARLKRIADGGPESIGHLCEQADADAGIWYIRASDHIRVYFYMHSSAGRPLPVLLTATYKKGGVDVHGISRARDMQREFPAEMDEGRWSL